MASSTVPAELSTDLAHADQAKRGPATYNRLGFWALIVTQFQGAFNDNLFRWAMVFYLLNQHDNLPATALVAAMFNLPWLLFPAFAGALADRFSKKRVTVWTKIWEIGVMSFGVLAIVMQNPVLILATLFLMAMQSTFFSPAKYGILPEMLPEQRLSWGNGQINMWTFVAIILGTGSAGMLVARFGEEMHMGMLFIVGFSAFGFLTSLFVTPVPPAEPLRAIPRHPYEGLGRYFQIFYRDRRLFITMIGLGYFWGTGTLMLLNVTELGNAMFAADELFFASLMLAVLTLGIGVGSLTAGYLSRGKIEVGLVPLGLGGMACVALLLALPGLSYAVILVLLFHIGAFAGLFDVPLAATLQQRSPNNIKGGMIATSNVVTFSSMMLATGLFYLLYNLLDLGTDFVFLTTAVITLAMLLGLCYFDPMLTLRFKLWLVNTFAVRMRPAGREYLPEKGGVLLVGNHISVVDALLLQSAISREIHFVVGADLLQSSWNSVARGLHTVPVAPKASETELNQAVEKIRGLLKDGHCVCVNTEAVLSAEGSELPWHQDYTTLTQDTQATVVPVYMARLWQTLYTFEEGKVQWRWPGFRFPVPVRFGPPLDAGLPAHKVREAVQRCGMESYLKRAHRFDLLHEGFIRSARKNKKKLAVSDAVTGELSYFKLLVGSIVFARKLHKRLDDNRVVGVLLPPSIGGTLTNLALQIMGRTVVNLNYTVSPSVMASCAQKAGLTQVLTSKKFLEKLPLEVPGETVLLEDIKETVTGKDRIVAMLYGLLAPVRTIEKSVGAQPRTENDLATIIFSSGSESEPKGVMLTHRNIVSNIESALETFPTNQDSCVVGYLPFFHSFGYMATLWMPLTRGLSATYHANPLEPKVIGGLVQKYRGTIMIGTSTFLQSFLRRCEPEQLQSLEFVICGAEKLTSRVRLAFKEKFGVEPLEGYGTTECAPAVSVNIPDLASPGFYYRGTRHDTIGRPIPGISVRIVDPDSGAEMPLGESGMLLVKGPNIMRGYLEQPEKTASVLKDGWYETGDIATIDNESFIAITDRLARFSKIAGEMVPHTKVEETLHGLLGLTEQSLAVASLPDPQKGEKLVVLHILPEEQLQELLGKLDQTGLPNLWVPRASNFHRIDEIPVLGTGKIDIKTIKKKAAEVG